MQLRPLRALASALALAALALPAGAQETVKPETAKAPEAPKAERRDAVPTATLRVQVVVSRFQGERKLASLPYSVVVTANGNRASMRLGVDTPIPTASGPSASFQYRNVGTNLDCGARDLGDGRYQLMLSVENSSSLAGPGAGAESMPLFRRFEVRLDPVLRDGQSVQTVAATDPVTGEVVKIDVTLNVAR